LLSLFFQHDEIQFVQRSSKPEKSSKYASSSMDLHISVNSCMFLIHINIYVKSEYK
jgi:hypothetical protein